MNNLRNRTMSRQGAIARAERHFDSGAFKADLARRVAIPSESQNPQRGADLRRYIDEEMKPALDALGFASRVLTHPKAKGPFLLAERIESSPDVAAQIAEWISRRSADAAVDSSRS